MQLNRTLKMGMVGGGPGAFIGEVHRKAARMDGGVEIVGGAFDIDPKKSRSMAKDLLLDPKRCYSTYQEMIEKELKLPSRRADGFRLGHHAQQLAFPDRPRPAQGRLPCHVRKADDDQCRRGAATGQDRQGNQTGLRPDAQLYRLPDGQAGPRHGPQRRARARSARSSCSTRRAGWRRPSNGPARCRPRGGPTPSRAAAPAAAATSAPTPRTWPNTSPA